MAIFLHSSENTEVIPEFTCVVGVDAHCLPYLKHTVPTWRKNQPALFERPWLVFFDPKQVTRDEVAESGLRGPTFEYVPWIGTEYENQRASMLSAHVYICRQIQTPYSLKIDCDALAVEPVEFPKAEWFEGEPVICGSQFGYTRAKGGGGDLDEWVERLEAFGDKHFGTERAGWADKIRSREHPKGAKLGIRRFVSWIGFQRTDWVRQMCDLFESDFGPGKLPVPSQDTSLWAAAVRSGSTMFASKQVTKGWANRTSVRGCAKVAKEILG